MSRFSEAFHKLLDGCYDDFSCEQAELYLKWDFEGCRSWELIPEAGVIGFARDDGVFVVADIQIIGSFVPSESIWQWAWSHAGMDDALKVDSLVVKEHGEEKGFEALTEPQVEADPMLLGGLMALTVKLTGSDCIWEGHDDGVSVMIAMRNIREERPASGKLDELF